METSSGSSNCKSTWVQTDTFHRLGNTAGSEPGNGGSIFSGEEITAFHIVAGQSKRAAGNGDQPVLRNLLYICCTTDSKLDTKQNI